MKKLSSAEKKRWSAIALLAGGLLLIAVLSILCIPFFKKLSDPIIQQQLRTWISSLGFGGWLLLLAAQILQIIIAFIPGEPLELLAGVLYGTWGGLATCLLGIVLASSAVFFTVRRFGYPLVARIFGEKKVEEFKFLHNVKQLETVTFLLFLIPGTPKDMLTYIAGISAIKPAQFLLIATFARIPSVITSTLMGSAIGRGNLLMTALIFLLTAAIGLFGIFTKDRIMDKLRGTGKK